MFEVLCTEFLTFQNLVHLYNRKSNNNTHVSEQQTPSTVETAHEEEWAG